MARRISAYMAEWIKANQRNCECGRGQPIRIMPNHHNAGIPRFRPGHNLHGGLTAEERFWKLVQKGESCWLWGGRKNKAGYGDFSFQRKTVLAHRFSWQLHHGTIPDGLWVLHRCDVPLCVNPDHLWLGTHADNMADMIRKGRRASFAGLLNGRAKLTPDLVRLVRARHAAGETAVSIAADLQMDRTSIGDIIRGRTWRTLS